MCRILNIKNRLPFPLPIHPLILEHPIIDPDIFALHLQRRRRRLSIKKEVIIAMRTILITT